MIGGAGQRAEPRQERAEGGEDDAAEGGHTSASTNDSRVAEGYCGSPNHPWAA